MLQLPPEEEPLEAALILREDAARMGVSLPVKVQVLLLDESLKAFNLETVVEEVDVSEPPAEAAEAEDAEAPEASEAASEASEAPEASTVPSRHLKNGVMLAEALVEDGHVRAGASAATLCSMSWLFWHLETALSDELRKEMLDGRLDEISSSGFFRWSTTLEAACATFHSQVGFSPQLPRGFFRNLETSEDLEAQRMVKLCTQSFGRFYPKDT
eukprot:symbB.v1.2.015633.t1/scaffold1142.1/size245703/2